MSIKEELIEKAETIAEEINISMGLDARVIVGRFGVLIELDTLAGRLKYSPTKESVMYNYYRLVSHYGGKLHKWGLDNKVEELNKEI